ncbi:hypothetical protein [Bacillus sp. Brlt_9]
MQFTEVKIEVFIPEEYIELLRDAFNKIHLYETPMIYIIPILNVYFEQV